jgi:hypothetical protein
MAAGDRKNNGKPKDIVRHYIVYPSADNTLCGRLKWGYASCDKDDVTCFACLHKLGTKKQKPVPAPIQEDDQMDLTPFIALL